MFLITSLLVAFVALVVERVVGYPAPLQRTISHPVVWIGRLIGFIDERFNRPPLQRLKGMLGLSAVLAMVLVFTLPLTLFLRGLPWGWVAEALIATSLLAQADLRRHVEAVADGLETSLADGRAAVKHLVGRDTAELDETGVARAAIESLAENASDSVVAPVLWLALLGLPGIALYKTINTSDSMIGHLDHRHREFGWAAARLDDLVNLPAARLTGLLMAAVSARPLTALRTMSRYASRHASPNAGWPEAAMAGALGIRLGGPRSYHGATVDLAWMGDGRETISPGDIRAALALYGRMLTLLAVLVALAMLAALAFI